MKEVDVLTKSLSEIFMAFTRLVVKMNEKLDTILKMKNKKTASKPMTQGPAEKKAPAKKMDARKPALKMTGKLKGGSKAGPGKTAGGIKIVETVRKTIEDNPGITFKSLQEKSGFDTKQIQNALPALKKAGKIKSEGKGTYFPVS
jgi:predicted HTH transcriptional regulator